METTPKPFRNFNGTTEGKRYITLNRPLSLGTMLSLRRIKSFVFARLASPRREFTARLAVQNQSFLFSWRRVTKVHRRNFKDSLSYSTNFYLRNKRQLPKKPEKNSVLNGAGFRRIINILSAYFIKKKTFMVSSNPRNTDQRFCI